MTGGLTQRQYDALSFIERHCITHGTAPSFEEIAKGLNLKSKSGIFRIVCALEERGFIRRQKDRMRSITIVQKKCPHCGGSLL